MKNLTRWAAANKRKSRALYTSSAILFVTTGVLMGFGNAATGGALSFWPVVVPMALGIAGALTFPKRSKEKPKFRFKNTYRNRILGHAAIVGGIFSLSVGGGHLTTERLDPWLFPSQENVATQPESAGPHVSSTIVNPPTEAEAAGESRKRVQKRQVAKKHRTLFKKRPSLSKAGKVVLLFLGSILAFFTGVLMLGVACSISCGGGPAVAASILGVFGLLFWMGAIALLVLGIVVLAKRAKPAAS